MKIIIVSILAVAMIGLMIPSVFSESTIQLYTDKKEYNMNDIIHITGKVNFVDGKAVGIGLPQGMKTVLEVYDSKNKLISTSIQDNISNTFFFDIDTGVNTKLNKDDRYTFLVFYGLVSPELRNAPNSSYVGNTHAYVGISAVEYSIKPPGQNIPQTNPQPTTESKHPQVYATDDPIIDVIVVVVAIVVIIGIAIKVILKRGSRVFRHKLSDYDLQNNFQRFNEDDAEDLVGLLFEKKGYTVEVGVRSKSGEMKRSGDFGIDVRATINTKKYSIFTKKEKLGIQVKHWVSNVGFDDAAKTMGVSDEYDKVIIVSTKSDFSHQVYENKKERKNWKKLELWNSKKFKNELRRHVLNSNQKTKFNSKKETSKTTSTNDNSSSDYFRLNKCYGCERKFSRFTMKKTTSDTYENIPSGVYICNKCSTIYRKWERINKGIFKESTLRNFRALQEYAHLEPNSTRENVTTDEEFDVLITQLEINAETEWEFSAIEKMILESLLLEFSQRRHARAKKDDQSKQEHHEEYYEKDKDEKDKDEKQYELQRCYKILGCSSNTPFEDIKKRYKQLVLDFHPDKNPEVNRQKWANDMMTQLNKAWEIIKKSFENEYQK